MPSGAVGQVDGLKPIEAGVKLPAAGQEQDLMSARLQAAGEHRRLVRGQVVVELGDEEQDSVHVRGSLSP